MGTSSPKVNKKVSELLAEGGDEPFTTAEIVRCIELDDYFPGKDLKIAISGGIGSLGAIGRGAGGTFGVDENCDPETDADWIAQQVLDYLQENNSTDLDEIVRTAFKLAMVECLQSKSFESDEFIDAFVRSLIERVLYRECAEAFEDHGRSEEDIPALAEDIFDEELRAALRGQGENLDVDEIIAAVRAALERSSEDDPNAGD